MNYGCVFALFNFKTLSSQIASATITAISIKKYTRPRVVRRGK